MKDDLQTKNTTVSSFETKLLNFDGKQVTKYIVKDKDGDKFNFYQTKKDGGPTKAYDTFCDINFTNDGNPVAIVFKAQEKSFVNEQGTTVNFTDRTVMWFEGSPVEKTNDGYQIQDQSVPNQDDRITALEQRVSLVESKLAVLAGKQESSNVSSTLNENAVTFENVPLPPEPQGIVGSGPNDEICVEDIPFN